jgi:hypothetical protein
LESVLSELLMFWVSFSNALCSKEKGKHHG